jgi:2,4-dienoyl-CoA reductase-like NADH-dependent reductase (Old Yellow Enzyme family)
MKAPTMISLADIKRIQQAFVDSARRALAASY